jgi:hypothetical protein
MIQRSRRYFLIVVPMVLAVGCAERAPLPSHAAITRCTVAISQSAIDQGRVERFDVPEAFYKPIIEELKRASFDPKPKKWEGMGGLDITYGDQQELSIALYLIPADEGWELAYSIDGKPRNYYRGGDAVRFEKLIREAHRSQAEQ